MKKTGSLFIHFSIILLSSLFLFNNLNHFDDEGFLPPVCMSTTGEVIPADCATQHDLTIKWWEKTPNVFQFLFYFFLLESISYFTKFLFKLYFFSKNILKKSDTNIKNRSKKEMFQSAFLFSTFLLLFLLIKSFINYLFL